ncbi:hypothetical protein SteCoe_34956 [Stentor coeruleus]|uniref:Uncharacterized protein n=1 Tax=Stentor coeruleus TaxID=5963 RepID=A0A1R2ATD9_9CILI|nr:hypothetical protein SteCoe_34956 [Stentor coeruleus]
MDQNVSLEFVNSLDQTTSEEILQSLKSGIYIMTSLLYNNLYRKMGLLIRTKNFTATWICKISENHYKKLISLKLTKWTIVAKRASKILNGLKILETQKKRKDAEKRKNKKKNSDLEAIKQEKALTKLARTIKRCKTMQLVDAFQSILNNQIKHSKAYYYIKLQEKKYKKHIIENWHQYVIFIKLRRKTFIQTIKFIRQSVFSKLLKPIIGNSHTLRGYKSSNGSEILKSLFQKHTRRYFLSLIQFACSNTLPKVILALGELEKVSRVYLHKYFIRILSFKFKMLALRATLGTKIVEKIFFAYTQKYTKTLLGWDYNEKALRLKIGLIKIAKVGENTSRIVLKSVIDGKKGIEDIKVILGFRKIQKTAGKSLRKAFEVIKIHTKLSGTYQICIVSPKDNNENSPEKKMLGQQDNKKSYIYIPQLLIPYLTKLFQFLLKKHTKFQMKFLKYAFLRYKLYTSYTKITKAVDILNDVSVKNYSNLIEKSWHTMKIFIKKRAKLKSQWKKKFNKLRRLYRKILKKHLADLKVKTFNKWKKYVKKITSLNRKFAIKRVAKLYSLLQIINTKYQNLFIKGSFRLLKRKFMSKKRLFYNLEKLYKKNLMKNQFENFKNMCMSLALSPIIHRKSQNSYISLNELSPKSSLGIRSGLLQPKRYGFYSVKRLSLDQAVPAYMDKIIKSTPPAVEKCNTPNIGALINRSSVGEVHSRNKSLRKY